MSKWLRLMDVYADMDEDPAFNDLRQPGIRLVPGDGSATAETARVLVVGEAPGATENGRGKPFCGASGVILDGLLGLAGLERSKCFVTNVVKYRPAGNATPTAYDQISATPYLRREWSIIRPMLTIAVGSVARSVLYFPGDRPRHGILDPFQKAGIGHSWITSVFHPAYGLRKPAVQPLLEEEWALLGRMIKEVIPILLEV